MKAANVRARTALTQPERDQMPLSLSDHLHLPVDAVTQTFAILGKRGSGKTTTATVLTEELLAAGQPVVVIDPLDVTWGLRSSRDGKAPGYAITVLGGDLADLPLDAASGAAIAEFVVEHHAPIILSLRHFSLTDQRRFVTDFAERLYALKGKQTNRTALHLVIDEVDEFAHQRIPAGHERLFGAIDRIVRRGRSAGLGVTMISQRPAVIHKDILSQAEVLICHQTISPQDRKALEAWIESHDAHDQRSQFLSSISSLRRGEAWVWSPGWLDVFERVTIRDRQTFDSSATPKAGEAAATPKQLATVDLAQLEARIAATVEKAKADDPKELRRRLLESQQRIAQLEKAAGDHPTVEPQTVAVVSPAVREQVATLRGLVETSLHEVYTLVERVERDVLREVLTLDGLLAVLPPAAPVVESANAARKSSVVPGIAKVQTPANLARPQQRILSALLWGETYLRAPSMARVQVAFLADASPRSSAYVNNLGALRTAGLIDYPGPGIVSLTTPGRFAAQPDASTPQTSAELQAHICGKLPSPQARIVEALCDAYPIALSREALARQAQASATSSAYVNNLGALRSLGLIDYPRQGYVQALPVLFLETV